MRHLSKGLEPGDYPDTGIGTAPVLQLSLRPCYGLPEPVSDMLRIAPSSLLILLVSMAIAWTAPFDVAFGAATFDLPWLRALIMAAIAIIGTFFAAEIQPEAARARCALSMLIGITAAIMTAVYVLAIDCFVFRSTLQPGYVAFMRSPLESRLIYFTARTFNENVLYRLFAFAGIIYAIRAVKSSGALTAPWLLIAMIFAQSINIAINVVAPSYGLLSPVVLIYDAFRFVAPGIFWAFLFWRYGFATAEVAAVGCHVVLQPLIGILI